MTDVLHILRNLPLDVQLAIIRYDRRFAVRGRKLMTRIAVDDPRYAMGWRNNWRYYWTPTPDDVCFSIAHTCRFAGKCVITRPDGSGKFELRSWHKYNDHESLYVIAYSAERATGARMTEQMRLGCDYIWPGYEIWCTVAQDTD